MPHIPVANFGYDFSKEEPAPPPKPRPAGLTLPSRSILDTSLLPPVGTQGTATQPGSPGSCCAWATVYGLATYNAAKRHKLNPHRLRHQASPAYTYIKVLAKNTPSGTCGDTSFIPYLKMIAAGTVPAVKFAPYVPDCLTLWSKYGTPTIAGDLSFTFSSYSKVGTSDLDSIKQIIANGDAIAYATDLYDDWNDYKDYCQVPYVGNQHVMQNVGHCMLIIGYDDTIGALLIQNSQGTDWGTAIDVTPPESSGGPGGYIWMAYGTFKKLARPTAYYFTESSDSLNQARSNSA